MNENHIFDLYSGEGKTLLDRNLSLPPFRTMDVLESNDSYIASPRLRDAVNVSLALGQPLLLTGEPGTGKTRLAYSIAHELGLDRPLVFHTKTTSNAKDLFYRYDSLAHFHDAQLREKGNLNITDYITYEALGTAIRDSQNKRHVVLIDEIDKAPRDLPNDVLNEFEEMAFTVQETGESFEANLPNRPILILTSNSEKNLPDAFLRRVVYYHIPFPDKATLERIITARLVLSDDFKNNMLKAAIQHFVEIRQAKGLRKPPATAELLSWIHILHQHKITLKGSTREELEKLAMSYSILAKNKEDLEKLKNLARP
ncbi:MAG: MoxR family ATPase [Bacteroidota bacterium]